MKNKNVIVVTEPFIDRLTFVVEPIGSRKETFAHALEIAKSGAINQLHKLIVQGARYRRNYGLMFKKKQICLCQFDPLTATNAAFRFEISPNNAGDAGMDMVRDLLTTLFGQTTEIVLRNAFITGMDIALDIVGECMDDLMVYNERTKKSSVYFGHKGQIETQYLGAPTSDKQIRMYNKRAEILHREKRDVGEELTRLEASLKVNRTSLTSLCQLENPFAGISIVKLGNASIPEGNSMWALFLDSCRFRGMPGALARIAKLETREKYRNRCCTEYQANWWNPEAIWGGFTKALQRLKLFPPSSLGIKVASTVQSQAHSESTAIEDEDKN